MNINDGTLPAQSRVLRLFTPTQATPTTADHFEAWPGRLFVAENFDLTLPTQGVDRHSEANAPSGGVQTDDFITGTATLQLTATAAATDFPLVGDHFGEEIDGTIVVNFFITEAGAVEAVGALKTCRVSFMQRVDSVTLPAAA